MKKVSELIGAELDFFVAKAEELDDPWFKNEVFGCVVKGKRYAPSTDWSQGGPLIQRERISLAWIEDDGNYQAYQFRNGLVTNDSEGDDALEAAMRCFVSSRFGDTVDDE